MFALMLFVDAILLSSSSKTMSYERVATTNQTTTTTPDPSPPAWESLRRDARHLEHQIDGKLIVFASAAHEGLEGKKRESFELELEGYIYIICYIIRRVIYYHTLSLSPP
jgi:hypothetical protein